MPAEERLSPSTPEDLKQALAHALQSAGCKRFKHATNFMAEIIAAHLVEYLWLAGFVVMKKRLAGGGLRQLAAGLPIRLLLECFG